MIKFSKKIKIEIDNRGLFAGMFYVLMKMGSRVVTSIAIKIQLHKNQEIIENRIVFTSMPDYADNCRAVSEYIQSHEKRFEIIWLMQDVSLNPIDNINCTAFKNKYGELSVKCIPIICTAKYIFFTHESPFSARWFKTKADSRQIVVNLWHGCGYKDKEKNESVPFVKKEYFDYAVVPGDLFIATKTKFWGCDPTQIISSGYPRFDWLVHGSRIAEEIISEVRKSHFKIIIWMPTFRKNTNSYMSENYIEYDYDLPLLRSDDDLVKLDEYCLKNKIQILIKRHPQQKEYSCEKFKLSNIIFINDEMLTDRHTCLYEFLKYTDALISDYSSVAFDYLLTDKPIAFCLNDYELYSKARGFVFDDPLKYMPGEHLYNMSDMLAFIEHVAKGIDDFSEERRKIRSYAINEKLNYTEAILDAIDFK